MDYVIPKNVVPRDDVVEISFSVTRPSSTTQYAINDVLAASTATSYAIALDGVGARNGQYVEVVGGNLVSSTAEATLPQLDLWLFTAPPASPVDNAAFTLTDAEMLTCATVVNCNIDLKSALNSRGQTASNFRQPCKLGSTTTSLYMLVVMKNTYTPVANEIFSGKLYFKRSY